MAAIWDDILARLNLAVLTKPCLSLLIWGLLYYLWMVVIAVITVNWKRSYLGDDDFDLSDGYWFAYISSTTVGLGDYFLEPEVFVYSDLFTFNLIFLAGFVLIAAFLSKFGDALTSVLGKRSVIQDLLDELEKTELLPDMPTSDEVAQNLQSVIGGRTTRTTEDDVEEVTVEKTFQPMPPEPSKSALP